jgi:hypothetical protein
MSKRGQKENVTTKQQARNGFSGQLLPESLEKNG